MCQLQAAHDVIFQAEVQPDEPGWYYWERLLCAAVECGMLDAVMSMKQRAMPQEQLRGTAAELACRHCSTHLPGAQCQLRMQNAAWCGTHSVACG